MNTNFYVADLGVAGGRGIIVAGAGLGTNNVVVNSNAFFTPTQARAINAAGAATTIDLLSQEATLFGLNYGKMGIDDFQAATLLHELGHVLGGLADDRFDQNVSVEDSRKIWRDCFSDLKLK